MNPEDIKDEATLKAWLIGQTREVAVTIAHRAAMRVAPVFWRRVRPMADAPRLTALSVSWPNLISGVAGTFPSPRIGLAACAADAGASAFADDETTYKCSAAAALSALSAYAGSTADPTWAATVTGTNYDDKARRLDARAAASAAVNAHAVDAHASGLKWAASQQDADVLAGQTTGQVSHETPLWPDGENPLADDWQQVRTAWAVEAKTEPGWQFWIDWYDAALEGRPLLNDWDRHWALLTDIALIDPEIWDKGPDAVNPEVAKIWLRHAEAATGNSEVIEGSVGDFHVVPFAPDPPDALSNTLRKVANLLDEFDSASRSTDMFAQLMRQLDRLRRCCAECASNAQGAFDDLALVRVNLTKAKESDELPPDDLVDDLENVLDTGLVDLLSSYDFVQETVSRRAAFRLKRDPSNLGAKYEADMLVIAAVSREDLSADFKRDLEALADPALDDESKLGVVFRMVSRGLRIARKGMKEGADVATDVAKIKRTAEEIAPGWSSIAVDLLKLVG